MSNYKSQKAILFQSYYSLISNHSLTSASKSSLLNFNPIIVLFLTTQHYQLLYGLFLHFNPIIVLFLTYFNGQNTDKLFIFQSYYSLISNHTDLRDSFIQA